MATGNSDNVKCLCRDNVVVEVDQATWEAFMEILNIRVYHKKDEPLVFSNISSTILKKILTYCERLESPTTRRGETQSDDEKRWISDEFLLNEDLNNLFELIKVLEDLPFETFHSAVIQHVEGLSEEEISQMIRNANLMSLLKIIEVAKDLDLEPVRSAVVQHVEGKSQEEISENIRNEDLTTLLGIEKVAEGLGLELIRSTVIKHVEGKSHEEVSQMIRNANFMSLIKLIDLASKLYDYSNLLKAAKSHVKGKSIDELNEAILNLDLRDLIRIVEVSKKCKMPQLHNIVVHHLGFKSREELSQMVGTKLYGEHKRNQILYEAEKIQQEFQVEFKRKRDEATNNSFLAKRKELLQTVVLPNLDDQSLIRLRATCTGTSKLVDPLIRSRGIILRKGVPVGSSKKDPPVEITLVNDDDVSIKLSSKASLASTIWSDMRVKKLERFGKDYPITHKVGDIHSQILGILGSYCDVASSEDGTAIEKWAIEYLVDARNQTIIGTIKAAQKLKMEGLLLKASEHMAHRIKGKTVWQMRKIFGFLEENEKDERGLLFNGSMSYDDVHVPQDLVEDIQGMRRFLELTIPRLDDSSYLCFAAMYKACAVLVNDVEARKCFLPGQQIDPWNISVLCSDNGTCKASETVIELSGLLKNEQIENPIEDTLKVSLKYTTKQLFARITQYCEKHATSNISEDQLKIWDANFLKKDDANTLLDLAQAAQEMKIRNLVDLIAQTFADKINKKTVLQIRAVFDIKKDFKGSEESDWRGKHEWAFESDPLPIREGQGTIGTMPLGVTVEDLIAHWPESKRKLFTTESLPEGPNGDEEAAREDKDKLSREESDESESEDSDEDDAENSSEEEEE